MKSWKSLLVGMFALAIAPMSYSHETHADATYIANEGILVAQGDLKILFDPFFTTGFGTYTEVPKTMLDDINAQNPPFDSVDAIFVSHVHGDHFDAEAVFSYLNINQSVTVFLPEKGAQQLKKLAKDKETYKDRVIAFNLTEGGKPKTIKIGDITVDAVRIPHSGWPETRRDINNILFRVTLANGVTVAHMGDADVNDVHFAPYESHWEKTSVDHAFPPYWYLGSEVGQDILNKRIRAKAITGVHVPTEAPEDLVESGFDYFSKPGETRIIAIPQVKTED